MKKITIFFFGLTLANAVRVPLHISGPALIPDTELTTVAAPTAQKSSVNPKSLEDFANVNDNMEESQRDGEIKREEPAITEVIPVNNNAFLKSDAPVEVPEFNFPPVEFVGKNNVEKQILGVEMEAQGTTVKEIYETKLSSVLENIRVILPALAELQVNMTELLRQSSSKSENPTTNKNPDRAMEFGQSMAVPVKHPGNLVKLAEKVAKSETTESPKLNKNSGSDDIRTLIAEKYIVGKSLENLTGIIDDMPVESQLLAYSQLSHLVAADFKLKTDGRLDFLAFTCLIDNKFPENSALDVSSYKAQFQWIFRRSRFQLKAEKEPGKFKKFYLNAENSFGIANNIYDAGTLTQWTLGQAQDCYFLLKSASNFSVGVEVIKGQGSVAARLILQKAGSLQNDFKYQWKLHPIRLEGRQYFLFENRDTNLALEWTEVDKVILNPVTFQREQLWYI